MVLTREDTTAMVLTMEDTTAMVLTREDMPIVNTDCKKVIVSDSDRQLLSDVVRDVVILARRRLRGNNNASLIYINEDLAQRRASLAKKNRQLKTSRKINDCWMYNGKVTIKTLDNLIREVHADTDLEIY